ncbi:nitroreductase family deazaflavin-dependent oxidoreductase [Mycobacterium sp. MBM]|nr:nitroreductase family deazaflavin-dependent oxidoreductase [Mycobacterium sp. MBM]
MAEQRVRPPWWLKYVNRVFIGLSKLGIGGDKGPVILTVAGRKTGKPRSTPVTPMTVEGSRYVVGGLPGADWVANARAAGTATLHQGRRTQQVQMTEMPPDQARPLLRQFPTLVPTGVSFIRNAGLVDKGTPDEFEALAGRLPVFRFDEI